MLNCQDHPVHKLVGGGAITQRVVTNEEMSMLLLCHRMNKTLIPFDATCVHYDTEQPVTCKECLEWMHA